MKEKYLKIKDWVYENPKKVYKYAMIFLILSFVLSIIQFYYFPSKMVFSVTPPPSFTENNSAKLKSRTKEIEMEKIVKELELFKVKRDKGSLTKADSLRIDYLFNQYQKLK
ncbi:hypothetical protein CMT22_16005 [Elizabethkingia anophelis]|nr:hypothetical protein [Elizabethkingia anophelis]MDV4098734.1 hypothetical protein [Elizabethkingia anophelis]HAY3591375.1 hypothetical protein [Elizabethkingia anophelis]